MAKLIRATRIIVAGDIEPGITGNTIDRVVVGDTPCPRGELTIMCPIDSVTVDAFIKKAPARKGPTNKRKWWEK